MCGYYRVPTDAMFPRSGLTHFCVNVTLLKAAVSCRDNMATSPNEMYEMPFSLHGKEYVQCVPSIPPELL